MTRTTAILDGNEAAADVAYRLNEGIAIYPITPASPMGEWSDQWQDEGRKNIWGAIPKVIEINPKEEQPAFSTGAAGRRSRHYLHRVAGRASDTSSAVRRSESIHVRD